jgi:hypothetical protein
MQATDFGNLDDHAELWGLDWPSVGCIIVERKVSSRLVIVRDVAGQDTAQMRFTKDKHMIQTLAPDRADEHAGPRASHGRVTVVLGDRSGAARVAAVRADPHGADVIRSARVVAPPRRRYGPPERR